jgi:hypothetical protein
LQVVLHSARTLALRLRCPNRARLLELVAPLAFLGVVTCWLVLLAVGFALLAVAVAGIRPEFAQVLGFFLFTLVGGSGPLAQLLALAWWFCVAIVVLLSSAVYLIKIGGAYGHREQLVARMAGQALRPTDAEQVLATYLRSGTAMDLDAVLAEWTSWLAEVNRTHSAYPVLVVTRSTSDLCWLHAAMIMLDAAAIVEAVAPGWAPPHTRALLRIGSACLQRIARQARIQVRAGQVSLHGREEHGFTDTLLVALAAGMPVERSPRQAWVSFQGWRREYAPHAAAIALRVLCGDNDPLECPEPLELAP